MKQIIWSSVEERIHKTLSTDKSEGNFLVPSSSTIGNKKGSLIDETEIFTQK